MNLNCHLPTYFWDDAVQYVADVLNGSPCKSKLKRLSSTEILEGLEDKPPNSIQAIFLSTCMVYRKPGNNSLKKRSQRGLILCVSEEVKGLRC